MKLFHRRALSLDNAPFFPIILCVLLTYELFIMWQFSFQKMDVLLLSNEEEHRVIWSGVVEQGMEVSHRYIHSVERCPIIEKFTVDDASRLVLMESWNCSFGAGIASDDGTGRGTLKEGFYVIEDIRQPFQELRFSAASFTEHTLTINEETIQLSKHFPEKTIRLHIEQLRRYQTWFNS